MARLEVVLKEDHLVVIQQVVEVEDIVEEVEVVEIKISDLEQVVEQVVEEDHHIQED